MRSTNSCITAFIVVFFSVLLGACTQLPSLSKSPSGELEPQAETSQEAVEPIEEPFVAIARPETPKGVSVPAQAQKEFKLALEAMHNKKWQQAEDLLLMMSETYPQLAGVYTNLGISHQQQGEFEQAAKAYQFAIEISAHRFDAYANLGVVYRELGQFADAEKTYLDALAVWPHHRTSLINLGVLYDMYLGKQEAALTYFKLAQQLSDEEDRQLKGWIIDLQRRLARQGGG